VPESGPNGAPYHAGVAFHERTEVALATVIAYRGREDQLATRVAEMFGLELPAAPLRRACGPVAFIGAGPGRWLATCDGESGQHFEARLRGALGNLASVSDQSDGRAILRLSGPRARDVLAKGLPVDTDASVMRPGIAVVSAIAYIGVHLWQLDDIPTYDCAVRRSYAGSFLHWIEAASAEYRSPGNDLSVHG
jgi:sarcosine oxidase subunit gamma